MNTMPTGTESSSARQPSFGPAAERRITSTISWSAIFAGSAVAVGMWLMLHLLGLGIGLTAIDPDDAGSLKGVGIGTGIWSLIVPLIALFVGGLVAGRAAGLFDRPLSAIHGGVVWALTTIAFVTLLIGGLSSLLGTTARVAGDAVTGTAGLASDGASGIQGADVMGALGLSSNDLIAPINTELREQGKPAVTPEQLQAATKDVVHDAVRSGDLNRTKLIDSIADHTALTHAQAADVASQIDTRWQGEKQQLMTKAEAVGEGALQAAESTGKGLLVGFASMLLSLLAAVGGAVLGSTLWRRVVAHRNPTRTSTVG